MLRFLCTYNFICVTLLSAGIHVPQAMSLHMEQGSTKINFNKNLYNYYKLIIKYLK